MRHQNDAPPSSTSKPSKILTSSAMATIQVHSNPTNTIISGQPENQIASKCFSLVHSVQPQPPPSPPSSILREETTDSGEPESNVSFECDEMTSTTPIEPMLDIPTPPPNDISSQQTHQDDLEEAIIETDTRFIQEKENHRQSHKPTSIKLSNTQLVNLNILIKIIRNNDYAKFLELLGSGQLKNLLNVYVDGQTALHYSLIYGRDSAWCKQLILNGANPNLTNRAGWHPIHLAAFNGSRETMGYLIKCIAN